MFSCEICSKSFNHKGNMQGHVKEVHYGKERYDIGVIPPSSHMKSQHFNEFKNEQFNNKQFENKQFENKQFGIKQLENKLSWLRIACIGRLM